MAVHLLKKTNHTLELSEQLHYGDASINLEFFIVVSNILCMALYKLFLSPSRDRGLGEINLPPTILDK